MIFAQGKQLAPPVRFFPGALFPSATVTVQGDGVGFAAPPREREGLGLSIVRATVRDKLGGVLRISSDSRGAKASFDFKATE